MQRRFARVLRAAPCWWQSKYGVLCGNAVVQRLSAPLFRAQDPTYLRIFKVLLFVIQPQITGPLYVRLAFHDAATWNKNATNKGGCGPRRTALQMYTFMQTHAK